MIIIDITPKYWASPASIGWGEDNRDLSFCLQTLEFFSNIPDVDKIERPVAGLNDRDLMMKFESLGDDCEFGFVQRAYGANPISLLRFGGLRLHRLHEALLNRFDKMDSPEKIRLIGHVGYTKYMVVHEYYRYVYHTFIVPEKTNYDKVFNNEVRRLKFCKRKLIEDLEEGEKIFVIKTSSPQGAKIEHVADIARLISQYGPGMLLWVVPSDDHNPSGTIKWHASNLLESRIDRLCEPGHATFHSPYWIPLCRRAYKAIEIRKLGLVTLPPANI